MSSSLIFNPRKDMAQYLSVRLFNFGGRETFIYIDFIDIETDNWHKSVKYKRKWILLIFLEFLQNDIYLNQNHQFWKHLSYQKPQLYSRYTNITKIVNITPNEDSFTLRTIVGDLAHNILLAIKRNNTSFTLFFDCFMLGTYVAFYITLSFKT